MTACARFDVLVAGEGLVGRSLACCLAQAGLQVALLDEAAPGAIGDAAHGAFAERAIALSPSSRAILSGIDAARAVWSSLAREAACIREIHIAESGGFGVTRLRASDFGLAALGHVLPARRIDAALGCALARCRGVTRLRGRLDGPLSVVGAQVIATVSGTAGEEPGGQLVARLLVAADGARSGLRARFGIGARTRDYRQRAIIANVSTRIPHRGIAFERFTPEGPLALLPLDPERSALVWSVSVDTAERLLALDDAGFRSALERGFGMRLGRILAAGPRAAFPLGLSLSRAQSHGRAVLIGSAANQLHPVAGQGFNLGLRDAATLSECIVDAVRGGGDPGSPAVIARYAAWREADRQRTARFTDALVGIFSNRLAPLAIARNAGLLVTDLVPFLGHGIARRAMGLAGHVPRLARGAPL